MDTYFPRNKQEKTPVLSPNQVKPVESAHTTGVLLGPPGSAVAPDRLVCVLFEDLYTAAASADIDTSMVSQQTPVPGTI